jgi:hypothetical protein
MEKLAPMNRLKQLRLAELNKNHDQAYAALVEAQRTRDEARRLHLGPEVESRHEYAVAAKKAALDAIEQEREPLLREHERAEAQHREKVKLSLSLAALTLSLVGNILQWLRWL